MDVDPIPDDPSKSSISNPPSIKHRKLLRPLFRRSGEDDGQYDDSSSLPTLHDLLSDEEKETYQKIKRQFNTFNRIKDFLLVMLSSPMTISYKAIYEDVVQDISKIYGQIRKLEADLISKDTDKLEYVKINFQVLSKSIQRLLDDSFLDEIETYIPRNMVQKIFKPLVLSEPLLMEAAVPGKMLEASSSARSAPVERTEMVEKETPQEILESAESSAPVERIETVEKEVPQEILELAVRSAARQISGYIVSKKFQNIRVYGEGESRVLLVLKKYLQKKYKYARPIFMVHLSHRQSNSLALTDIAEGMILGSLFSKSFILLLDGVSEKPNLKKIGILIKPRALVFTTGSHEISPKMQVDVEINMEDHLLAWKLFCYIVGESVHSSTLQRLAISIFEKCGGHLLAVVLMAKYLKNAIDVEAWKKALDELTSSKKPDMNEVVVKAIILNWGQMDILSKHCVRYCASHPKRTWFDKVSLISDWINDGIIFTCDEGKKILESLTCTFLLENIGKGESVMMQEQVYDIFVSKLKDKMRPLILNPGELKHGEQDFKSEEWGDFREIHLMDSISSELPESPNCPILLKLILQRNYDLIEIPPPFFKQMPVLQVLDLSYTSIRNLPDSLSSLVALRKFLLRGCELFMDLPPSVGELKNLEELDLDKTEIMHLPTEMGNLEKIKVLKVSFYEYMNGSENTVQVHQKIPSGVISNLSQLAELSIDVKPDDQEWDLTMKVIIKEVRSLKMLKTLKLYMPDATLLDDLRWGGKNLIYPYLSHFKFIVGRHKQRIIVRVPCEVGVELEKWDKCLKFVYGANVPIEIQKVLGYATAFFLDRHMSVTKLSEIGMENMKNLRFCILAECNQLQTLVDRGEDCVLESLQYLNIYYMRDLDSIWRGPIHEGRLSRLKFLELHTCPKLSIVFTPYLLHNLITLEELVIEDCPQVCNLLVSDATFDSASDCFFPNLKRMSLLYLPKLVSISCGSVCFAPKLESIGLYNCPKLINLSTKDFSSEKLKVIKGEQNWWEELRWDVSERGGQPEHLDRIFSPINNEEDVMTQLEKGGIYFNVQSKNESLLNSQVERKSLIYDTGTSDREMGFKALISDPVDKGKEMSKEETEARDVGPVVTEHMEETLHKRVIGQDDAVKAISWAICFARAGLKDPNRPIASFIFCGPTGVGKSELAKALAILYFGSEEALIRFDMNEFMERQAVSDLIGAPPGYVDYTEGGQLTEAVRCRPYTLVLFDKIEKAHPRVLSMIVKILDDGRLTDSKGRTVDFKNTLLIMTSSVVFQEKGHWKEFDRRHYEYDLVKSRATNDLIQYFGPELLNRVDDIIVFWKLTMLEMKQIADKMLKEVFQRLKTRGIELQVTERFTDRVVEDGDQMYGYGAWPLRRAIKRLLEENMAKKMLSRDIKEGDSVIVDVDSDGNITVS